MKRDGHRTKRDPRGGSTLLGVLALVSVLLFVALIALQVMEFLHYGANPTIWPAAAGN